MKRRTRRKRSQKAWKTLTRHHDIAKSLGGQLTRQNIYLLTAEHHQAYHKLFGLSTFEEAANILLRMQRFHDRKGLKRGECE